MRRSKRPGRSSAGIEHVGTVGRGDEDDAFVRLEAVHLDEQLVQRLLALVVAAAEAGAAMAADRVDLVDEDDAGGVLLALLEQVADARGADADEHLDEVGAADREERDVGFARDGAREQRLAGAGRAHEQHALGNAAAELLELLRFLEELDDLLELFLRFVDAGDVLERHLLLRAGGELRAALAERERLVPAALHLPHDEDPEADHQQDGRPRIEQRGPGTGGFGLGGDLDVLVVELVAEPLVLRRRVGAELGLPLPSTAVVSTPVISLPVIDDRLRPRPSRRAAGTRENGIGFSARWKLRREVPDQDPDDDEDHPEQQALEGRIQPGPPKTPDFQEYHAL